MNEKLVSKSKLFSQMILYGFRSPDMTVTEFVDNLPVADVAEVHHGWWVDNSDKWDKGMDLFCSICHSRASGFVGGSVDWWDSWKPKYCPHCGAKMDLEGKEK